MNQELKDQAETQPKASNAGSDRLISLDAFRGLTVLLMLLVNNTVLDTATPAQLTHAPWNAGLRLADMVFPWFIFCVGVAIPFASASFQRKGMPRWRYHVKAANRALILVALGCLIDSSFYKEPIFDLGVLQLIALAYLAGAALYELPKPYRISVAAALLIGYWAAIKFIPVPGVGVGVFEQERNLIDHINQTYLVRTHLSGLLSVIPTTALVLLGTLIGDVFRNRSFTHAVKIAVVAVIGGVLLVLGLIWNLHLPFNKDFWTPSYILFNAGTACFALALLYFVIDTKGWRWWSMPLVVFGANPIFAYVAPILVKINVLNEWTVGTMQLWEWYRHIWEVRLGLTGGAWIYTATYILAWWFVLWIMYRKKIFLRV